jgi:branched-chain amino acid transport system substrate-binding protein
LPPRWKIGKPIDATLKASGATVLLNITTPRFSAQAIRGVRASGDDLTRENVMAQAANLRDYAAPLLLPGIKINTSKTDYFPIEQMQMNKFDGTSWLRFGDSVPAQ